MAGLPKVVTVFIAMVGIVIALAIVGSADGIQTDSVVLPPAGGIQTGSNVLQPVFDLIDSSVNADPADAKALREDFEDAVTSEILTPEEALAMLALVRWDTLDGTEALANAAAALQTALADLSSDPLSGDDPLDILTRLLDALATPTGTLTAIGKAGASEEILDQVSSMVADGVPPGILVRITKQGLRDGLTMDEIAAQLDALSEAIDDEGSWGNVANDVTDKGENKHQDEEKNTNTDGNDEPEEEANTHGNSDNSSGKKDDNPGKGQDKDKDKDK
jgi:hypothetical protein